MVMLLWIPSFVLAASEQQTLLQTKVEVVLEVDGTVCPPQCESCCESSGTCQICNVGYHLNRDAPASDQCIPCTSTDCQHCSIDPSKCDECQPGLFLDLEVGSCTAPKIKDCELFKFVEGEETCERCLDGHRKEADGSCVKCDESIPHCRSCDADAAICDLCSPGFFLKKVGKKDCVACTAENCERCNDELSKCSSCQVGYTMNGAGLCVKCHQDGCHVCDTDRKICDECRPNFVLKEDSGTCCGPCPAGTGVEVCALNDKTYSNACEAGCANQHVKHQGRCSSDCGPDIKNEVCGWDGVVYQVYQNPCKAADAGVTIVAKKDCNEFTYGFTSSR